MSRFKLNELSPSMRLPWHVASVTFGICVALIAIDSGAFAGSELLGPFFIFGAVWLFGVLIMRLFMQQASRPEELKKFIFGKRGP